MRVLLSVLLLSLVLCSCSEFKSDHYKKILKEFNNSESDYVLVVAHRGDWRNAPENSIPAIENCIAMGVDVVEVDVRRTKDNHFVLMHDGSINRTTNGKGLVNEYTLQELKQFNLKSGQGGGNAELTEHKIPTLEEALLVAKGKIMLNLDKAYGLMEDIYPLLTKHETVESVILKGGAFADQVMTDISYMDKEAIYMPIIPDTWDSAVFRLKEHVEMYSPPAFELFLKESDSTMVQSSYMKENGARVWVNSLWASLCLGHEDAKAVKNPDENWGWIIEKGANIICTDNPVELLQYLRGKGLHN